MTLLSHKDKLSAFIASFTNLVDIDPDETTILHQGARLLKKLVSEDNWLPEEFSVPHAQYYQQYLIHLDPLERFSVVSFVWGPGQVTPIHNHTVWGLIGMLRGAEYAQSFVTSSIGIYEPSGAPIKLEPGNVESVSPSIGDIHQVKNAFDDQVSISIHVYGANIGKVNRSVFYDDGTAKAFVSGYANATAK